MWLKGHSCMPSPQRCLDEMEEMMLYLQLFRSVLSNMEDQLSEDQAAVYSSLSDQDRYTLYFIKLSLDPDMYRLQLQH